MKSHFQTTTADHPRSRSPDESPSAIRPARVLRRLEAALAGAVAAATGWLAATSDGADPMLWLASLLAAALAGWALLRPTASRRRPDDAGMDRSTALYNRGGLLAHGKELLADCRAGGRDLTLAVFECSDLVEARTIYGNRTSRKLVDTIVRKLSLLAGHEGLAARTGPTQFAIAMPMGREKAVQAIERVLGNPTRFELEGSKTEIVLVPNLMVETIPSAGTVERMFVALCRGLARIQEEERARHSYLQRERERHSRPMSIPPIQAAERPARPRAVPVLDADPVHVHQIPNTIPMPLGSR